MVEADPKPIAELRGVSKIYGSGELSVKALDQLDLVIREGDYLAVMGASGSGKSTAMNILGCSTALLKVVIASMTWRLISWMTMR